MLVTLNTTQYTASAKFDPLSYKLRLFFEALDAALLATPKMILYHDDVNGIGTQEQRPWSYKITRKWVLPDHNIDHGKYVPYLLMSKYVIMSQSYMPNTPKIC